MRTSRIRTLLPTLAAPLLVLALTGCGGNDDDAPAGDSSGSPDRADGPVDFDDSAQIDAAVPEGIDPCALLSEEEVAAAVGQEVARVDGPREEFLGIHCDWYYPTDLGEMPATLTVWQGDDFYSPDAPGAEVTGFEPVSGLGDTAHRWPAGQGVCTVIFKHGEYVAQVLTTGAGDDSCITLARVVDERLSA
ncbi:MAG TPA: hypothetical protein VKZ67_07325 [Natronosporangium sp.]|nr:hypothetical protein [Natronosporangium sp.]